MADLIRYVNPGSSGGDGTTPALSGPNAAYASMTAFNAAEAATHGNLVGDGNTMTVHCAGSTADTQHGFIEGWTTGPSNDITIIGNNTEGKYSTSKYRMEAEPSSDGKPVLGIREEYTTVIDIQVTIDDTTYNGRCIEIDFDNATSSVLIDSCIVVMPGNESSVYPITAKTACTAQIKNCLAYETSGTNTSHGYIIWAGTVEFFNCTVFGTLDGFERDGGTLTCTNDAAINIKDDGFEGTMTENTCISDAPNSQPTYVTAQTPAQLFTDPTAPTWDFGIKDTSSDLISTRNAGTNLYASGVIVDLANVARPAVGAFDLGARKFVAAGNPYPVAWLKKGLMSGFHVFLNQYIKSKVMGYDPLKLPDGTPL